MGHYGPGWCSIESDRSSIGGGSASRRGVIHSALRRLDDIGVLLDRYRDQLNVGKPGYPDGLSGILDGAIRGLGPLAVSGESGGAIMPPAVGRTNDQMLGELIASIAFLRSSHQDERDEGKERNRKLDVIMERGTLTDVKINDGLRTLEEKMRELSRAAIDQADKTQRELRDVKNSQSNQNQVLTSSIDLVNLHIRKLEAQVETTTGKMNDLATEQTKIRTEVADIKSDTQKLQAPVRQLVQVRNAIIAWAGALITITTTLLWLFHPQLSDIKDHLFKSIWP